uniref:Uncharacterized protein n=1 Tax=Pipistrellus kuhlii TaxID=59472 RepID=A0A7J7YYK6_PIPKU|nr:hypothetical protein mPipKuh1_009932 [Pipistrellus kuhlii]
MTPLVHKSILRASSSLYLFLGKLFNLFKPQFPMCILMMILVMPISCGLNKIIDVKPFSTVTHFLAVLNKCWLLLSVIRTINISYIQAVVYPEVTNQWSVDHWWSVRSKRLATAILDDIQIVLIATLSLQMYIPWYREVTSLFKLIKFISEGSRF